MPKTVLLFVFVFLTNAVFAAEKFSTHFSFPNGMYLLVFAILVYITYVVLRGAMGSLKTSIESADEKTERGLKAKWNEVFESRNVIVYISVMFLIMFGLYYFVVGTTMESHVVEWLNLIVRWAHVVFGIAWIGASFYFNFLENSLNRTENLRDELAGNLWAVHGGGFYYLEKYKIAPKEIPKHLHWFKYEAYFTWLSGFVLLIIVYYLNAKVYLIDPQVMDLAPKTAVAIGIGSLIVGWFVYDLLCKSRLSKNPAVFGLILFLFIAGASYLLLQVFSARAAYIHVGALIGTMMVGNVFRVIIPSQKAMVKAAIEGTPVNPQLGKNALLRSRHNNYLTLPVIFIMISNHYPSTYGSAYNWIVLMGLTITSVLVKHYLNKIEQGQKAVWIMPIAVIGMISMALITVPRTKEVCVEGTTTSFLDVQPIIQKRCVQCHSASPTDEVFTVAPNNIMLDTPEQCATHADRILQRAVISKTMPQVNKTGMSQEERDALQCWIEGGAVIR